MSELLNDNAKQGSAIPVRFTRLYITLFGILALLLTAGQMLTQWRLSAVQDELWMIRYVALQRHQCQQIAKQALQLTDPSQQANFDLNIRELKQVFSTFERYHLQGRQGIVPDRQITLPNSETVQRMYDAIRPEFQAYQQGVHQLGSLRQPASIMQADVQAGLKLILANEKPFLEKIDTIVREYTGEVRAKLTLLQTVELYLYVFTLLVLIGIGLFIFRPAARRLRQVFSQVIEAESQTKALNVKLLRANKTLKETRQKLFEAQKQQYLREIDQQKTRTSYLIAGQEEERKRLSRELHDGLGQMLTAIKLQLEGLEGVLAKSTEPDADGTVVYSKNLKTLKRLITQTIQETRTISNNLMPTVLSDFGVVPALKLLAENDRTEAVDVTFTTNLTPDMPRLNRDVEIMLYRVTQEAVSNAIRHGSPSHIRIDLLERANSLQLAISDDGHGFRPTRRGAANDLPERNETNEKNVVATQTTAKRPPSQGLHNMRERAKLLNGTFKLYSTPGKGTKIVVTIPYQTQLAHHDAN
ncbi:sensor histidine kinase [Spirosoma montaniterrae]|uniref:histidine kinase n=1 Tax=Spirosoma montaniterrae TaxID=1178516 RepID=A0A1P9WXF1_9BACT|nr:sensor histidine kinase [Spirosoma montaniterrae]AQG80023.1 histidine kinase [Spirosoma montaniterrae]